MSLAREVDKYLKKQAKLNEKSGKIIDVFLKQHVKSEVYEVLGYIETSGAPKHADIIKQFIEKYERNTLSVEDVKSYLTVFKLHKNAMKETSNISKEQLEENNE